MKLTALKSLRYAGRPVPVGGEFEASPKDAKLLKAIGKAEDAPEYGQASFEAPVTSRDQPANEGESHGRKAKYRTRQLKAADATESEDGENH